MRGNVYIYIYKVSTLIKVPMYKHYDRINDSWLLTPDIFSIAVWNCPQMKANIGSRRPSSHCIFAGSSPSGDAFLGNIYWTHIYNTRRSHIWISTWRPRQNGRHFPDDIFKWIFVNENAWISIKISLKFVSRGPINNISALVQIMAWRRPGDKPLSEPVIA